ncbi:hypothetical protein SCH01S_14_00220 [Sphingomonas changbaiensis NBRC 104936]|uniref:Uncharacterized protein n=1 Tax=Sphingomonas changbaiensis NBRC 104936 TaxID=1219043 RepID=A0A0E9MLG3_9SPHN|nr:hypothetical protein [Sphingomonas changbaiensis]GAO38358.1 hypothetical protein SCH01S_14_00220 [Sphingomonas changbaiensis NBRC 104936]
MNTKELTGQTNYQSKERLVLNEVLLNGDKGYLRKRVWVGRTKADEMEKPAEIELGKTANVIFLKIRRKLVERGGKGEIVRASGEHNTVNDIITIYENREEVFTGPAKEARKLYPQLRTVQIVYALLATPSTEPELVRITVKGASLGSDAKPEGVFDFYQYLGSFGDDAICDWITKLGVVEENGMKTYFAMTFQRGERVPERLTDLVLEKLQFVHDYAMKYDAGKIETVKEAEQRQDEPAIEYPSDEPDPNDIPF